jgi:hypothetical protein
MRISSTVLLAAVVSLFFTKMSPAAPALTLTLAGHDTAMDSGHVAGGHFYTDISTNSDNSVGLALVADKNGQPDPSNFTGIVVRMTAAKVTVRVIDCQHGIDNVLDNTHSGIDRARYSCTLDGRYSVPYSHTAHRLRIFRDSNAGFFHFYFAVLTTSHGRTREGWLELAPSHDWMPGTTRWYVMPVVDGPRRSPHSDFGPVRVVYPPKQDRNDSRTGFKVTHRDYNFSGFFGNATVITFGRHLPLARKNVKFVFWDLACDEPWWQIGDDAAFSYEHVETWDSSNKHLPGCFEPMSDRSRLWSHVDVIEDNAVRKRVRWSYVLCNPDYRVPGDGNGSELPEATEVYTFYPDGTGTRWITFKPNLDSGWDNWHELAEYMVIDSSKTWPAESLADPCLSIENASGATHFDFMIGDFNRFNNDQSLYAKQYEPTVQTWPQVALVQHFKIGIDAFSVWDLNTRNRVTTSGYTPTTAITWHNPNWAMCHWPVGKEPHETVNYTHATWKAQISEASTAGVEMQNDVVDGSHWRHGLTKIDIHDHRPYREWASLIGLAPAADRSTVPAMTRTWLNGAVITPLEQTCVGEGVDYRGRTIDIGCRSRRCAFKIGASGTLRDPAFRLKDFGAQDATISISGKRLRPHIDYETAVVDGDLLVWIGRDVANGALIRIQPR